MKRVPHQLFLHTSRFKHKFKEFYIVILKITPNRAVWLLLGARVAGFEVFIHGMIWAPEYVKWTV